MPKRSSRLTKDERIAAEQALDAAEARAQAWRNAARELRGESLGQFDDTITEPEPTAEKCETIADLTDEGVEVLRRVIRDV